MEATAYFVKKPRRLEDLLLPSASGILKEYTIAETVALEGIDYENFITDLLADRWFIEENSSKCSTEDAWKCILVTSKARMGGILVMPAGGRFVGWAAFCGDLSVF